MQEYAIEFEDREVGHACIQQQGLYMHIEATCCALPDAFYRLQLTGNHRIINLGTCLYRNYCHYWDTKIPAKNMPVGELKFKILKPTTENNGLIIINANKEFQHFSKILKCRFIAVDGAKRIAITE